MIQHFTMAALIAATALSPLAAAQEYPTRPIKAIVAFSAGSGPDVVMRLVGEKLARAWGQPIVVENRPGASGWIAMDAGKKAPADGYTLVQTTNEQMSLQPHLYKKIPYDAGKDFEPVAGLYWTNFFIAVPAASKWTSLNDLVAEAKARRGELTYGSWGIGSIAHVSAVMLELASGTQMNHIPFKELPQLYGGVANGEVGWAFGTAATTASLYQSKKVKYLALAAPNRLARYPEVPTVSEAGGPANFEVRALIGLVAPRGVPKSVIERINAEVNKALGEADVRERLAAVGFEPLPGTPSAFGEALAEDSRKFAEVVKRANISLD